MVKRTSFEHDDCPIARSLDAIGDWWSMLILREALFGVSRFGEFQKRLGLAKNILATRLRGLVADEADLLAAEANVAVRTLVACVVVAVAAAVFAVLGVAALLAMIAMQIVESGYSWPAALGFAFLMCAVGSATLIFALRSLTTQKLFAASRRELRGRA